MIPIPFFRIDGMARGLETAGSSPQFEGRFGRMFRSLSPAHFSTGALHVLAQHMTADDEGGKATPETESDDEENVGTDPKKPGISAGYTYFGQFIDHDLTFDPASSLQKANDPDGLVDFRTPRFDLDNIYGRGPDDQPYMYEEDGVRMLLGDQLTGNSKDQNARDVPRNSSGRAIIGDPRNDENVIVSQLQAAFLRFHNRVADVLGSKSFVEVQQAVRWHYQWVVINDFLKTVIGSETLHRILPHLKSRLPLDRDRPRLSFYKPRKDSFIPVEFSVAAYRFGHSMVRPQYRLNEGTPAVEGNPDPSHQNDPRLPIFGPGESLVGFRRFPRSWAVDWSLFFPMGASTDSGKGRVQPAYKIDTSLVNPLGTLPHPVIGDSITALAERNLLRGLRMKLPSGQAVARAMGEAVIPDVKLRVGKANEDGDKSNPTLVSLSDEFRGNAPLWYYILAEAQQNFVDNSTVLRLGPVGGRIVGEVFIGLMLNDSHSYLSQDPNWEPRSDFLNAAGEFGIAELLGQALKA